MADGVQTCECIILRFGTGLHCLHGKFAPRQTGGVEKAWREWIMLVEVAAELNRTKFHLPAVKLVPVRIGR
jgi:hypothetical protein